MYRLLKIKTPVFCRLGAEWLLIWRRAALRIACPQPQKRYALPVRFLFLRIPFLTASGFIDSFDNPSYYAGAGLVRRMRFNDSRDSMHFDVGVVGFLMTRQDYKEGDPFFGMLPALSFGTRRHAVNITYIPKVDPKMVALWFFQLKISTDNF